MSEYVQVPDEAVDWLKKHYPALCIKAGLCERIAGRLYTRTTIKPSQQDAPTGAVYARLHEIAYRDTATAVTVRADDLRALLARYAPAQDAERERDAERYRWIRGPDQESTRYSRWRIEYWDGPNGWQPVQRESMDAAIDAARAQRAAAQEKPE